MIYWQGVVGKLTNRCRCEALGDHRRRRTAGVERSGGVLCQAQCDDGEGGRLQHHDGGPGVKVCHDGAKSLHKIWVLAS